MKKILHINYSDQIGGAATAVMRLHKALMEEKVDSHILVKEKTTNVKNIISETTTISLIIDLVKKTFLRNIQKFSSSGNRSTFSMNLLSGISAKKINALKPDVVNLHWISNEMISLKEISKISAPLVWTLVDMWLFCGGEHYSDEKRYLTGYLKSNRKFKETGIDLNRYIWNKKKYFLNKKIKIVCISRWLANKAKKSKLLEGFDIRVINCAIDTDVWKPINKKIAKKILGLDPNKKIILFGATGGTTDPRKGFKYLVKALKKNKIKKERFNLLIFGEDDQLNFKVRNRKVTFKPGNFYGNDTALRVMYSAADLIVAPSLLEAFGQVASEAGSCETPCVAFKNTGFEDVIIHKKTGYLADYKDSNDLSEGILWCLKNFNKSKLGVIARRNVINKFSNKIISNQYAELYKEITKY